MCTNFIICVIIQSYLFSPSIGHCDFFFFYSFPYPLTAIAFYQFYASAYFLDGFTKCLRPSCIFKSQPCVSHCFLESWALSLDNNI